MGGIVISNENYDQYGNPTIKNGGTATTNSIGEPIQQYVPPPVSDKPYDAALPTGTFLKQVENGGYISVNEDGSPTQPGTYSQTELDSGIRIGGDTRTNEQIASDYGAAQEQYNTYRSNWQRTGNATGTTAPPPPPPTGAIGSQMQQPGSTTAGPGGAITAGPGTTGGAQTGGAQTGGELPPAATYIGPASINVGGDTTWSIADINPDGSIKWSIHKAGQPVSFQTMTQDQFTSTYGNDLASKYYGSTDVLPQTGQYQVTSYGTNSFVSEGQTFTIQSINPDGTINWKRDTDGFVFEGISPYEAATYFGSGVARYYPGYGGTGGAGGTGGTGTGGNNGGQLQVIPQYTNEHGWGAAGVTSGGFTWVNPETGTGDYFAITRNADGTVRIERSDGLIVESADRALFDQYFPTALGDLYFNTAPGGGPGGGLNPGTGTGGTQANVGGQQPLNPTPPDPNSGGQTINLGGQQVTIGGITAPDAAAPPDAAQYQAAQAGMNYDETVEGRVLGMLSQGNPLLEKAASMSLQRANARGLLNSSMANDAALSAMMQNAIPIAQADAGNLLQMRLQNAGFANQAAQFDADSINQMMKLGYTAQADLMKTALGGNIELQRLVAAGQIDAANQVVKLQSDMAMKEMELQYADKTRASQSAAATLSTLQQGITQILGTTALTAEAKAAAINQLVSHARGSLAVYSSLSGNINLVEQFDSIFTAPSTGDIDPSLAPPPTNSGTVYDYRDTNQDGVVSSEEQYWANYQPPVQEYGQGA